MDLSSSDGDGHSLNMELAMESEMALESEMEVAPEPEEIYDGH